MYSIKSDWLELFKSFDSKAVLEIGAAFCVEHLVVGESLSRLNEDLKAKFVLQYKSDLNLILTRCPWTSFDAYLARRGPKLSDEINDILDKLCHGESDALVPIMAQHGDFQFGNIIISDEIVTVIDWEAAFCGFGFYDFFVLTLGFRTKEFWEGLSFELLCQRIGESRITDVDVTKIALALLIEEHIYRNRKFTSIDSESNTDQLVLDKLTNLFRAAYENTIH